MISPEMSRAVGSALLSHPEIAPPDRIRIQEAMEQATGDDDFARKVSTLLPEVAKEGDPGKLTDIIRQAFSEARNGNGRMEHV